MRLRAALWRADWEPRIGVRRRAPAGWRRSVTVGAVSTCLRAPLAACVGTGEYQFLTIRPPMYPGQPLVLLPSHQRPLTSTPTPHEKTQVDRSILGPTLRTVMLAEIRAATVRREEDEQNESLAVACCQSHSLRPPQAASQLTRREPTSNPSCSPLASPLLASPARLPRGAVLTVVQTTCASCQGHASSQGAIKCSNGDVGGVYGARYEKAGYRHSFVLPTTRCQYEFNNCPCQPRLHTASPPSDQTWYEVGF